MVDVELLNVEPPEEPKDPESKPEDSPDADLYVSVLNTQADVVNANGRLYSRDVLEKAVAEAQEKIKTRGFLLYLDLVDDRRDVKRLQDVAGVVTSVTLRDDGCVEVAFELLETDAGEHSKRLLDSGIAWLAPYGRGEITYEDDTQVVSEYELEAIDVAPAER